MYSLNLCLSKNVQDFYLNRYDTKFRLLHNRGMLISSAETLKEKGNFFSINKNDIIFCRVSITKGLKSQF